MTDIGEDSGEHQQSIELGNEDDEDERDRSTSANGRQADVPRLKRLSEQRLHARGCRAIPLVPLEQLQLLLKALDAHLLRGRDKVLHRREQVLIAKTLLHSSTIERQYDVCWVEQSVQDC